MANVNKQALIKQLQKEYHYTKKSATTLVDDFVDAVLSNLRQGNTVSIRGFGAFDITKRKGRRAIDPTFHKECQIPEHWAPRFFPGNTMKRVVKMWADDEMRSGGDI